MKFGTGITEFVGLYSCLPPHLVSWSESVFVYLFDYLRSISSTMANPGNSTREILLQGLIAAREGLTQSLIDAEGTPNIRRNEEQLSTSSSELLGSVSRPRGALSQGVPTSSEFWDPFLVFRHLNLRIFGFKIQRSSDRG